MIFTALKSCRWRMCATVVNRLAAGLAFAIVATGTGTVRAQDYPARPVTMIVPFAPGGPTDVAARIVAQRMSATLGQNILVSNLPGAGGGVGSIRVAQSGPDGYTLLMANMGTQVLARATSSNLGYDPIRDFAPVGLVSAGFTVIVARKGLPAPGLKGLLAYARERQGKATYSSAGLGSVSHIICALFVKQFGLDVAHVPYKGAAVAVQDLVRGEIDFTCTTPNIVRAFVQSGAIVGVVMNGDKRSPLLPNVPTVFEEQASGFELNAWQALFAPRGTPAVIVNRLSAAMNAALREPAIQKQYEDLGIEMPEESQRGPEALAQTLVRDTERWLPLLRSLNLPRD